MSSEAELYRDIAKRLQKIRELSYLGKLINTQVPYVKIIDSGDDGFFYNEWSLLKLIFLHQYVPLYTSIIRKRFCEINYIDLFAGSGLNVLKVNRDIVLPGSPIIALAFARRSFTHAYFVDINSNKIKLLKKRVSALKVLSRNHEYRDVIFSDVSLLKDKYYIGDANSKIDQILSDIEERHDRLLSKYRRGCHNLIFIDPFGLTFTMKSLVRILDSRVRSDIILFVNTYAAFLQISRYLKEGKSSNALDNFLGHGWKQDFELYLDKLNRQPNIKDIVTFIRFYIKKVFSMYEYETVIIELPLKLKEKHFDLIFGSHRTSRGNPFLKAIYYLKHFIEDTDYALLHQIADAIANNRDKITIIDHLLRDDVRKRIISSYSTALRYGVKKKKIEGISTLDRFFG